MMNMLTVQACIRCGAVYMAKMHNGICKGCGGAILPIRPPVKRPWWKVWR